MSTIHDVAEAAGVSTATVSRALRGLPRVHAETRARVLLAAAELNYVASPTASGLASGKTKVVGVVVPFITRWFFAHLIYGAERALREHGYHVLLYDVGSVGSDRSLVLDQRLLWKRVDAVLVLSLALQDEEIAVLKALDLPVATVGVRSAGWPCVRVDDIDAARKAVRHLVDLGHRRIAYVGGNPAVDAHAATPVDRRTGYLLALAEADIEVDPALFVASDWTARGGVASANALLDRRTGATAVFAASDEMAIGVLHAMRARGLRAPQDLSVIGIDDHELAFTHDLSTVAQPVAEQGSLAAQLLLAALASGDDAGSPLLTVPTRLVVRGSTAAPASVPAVARTAAAVTTVGRPVTTTSSQSLV